MPAGGRDAPSFAAAVGEIPTNATRAMTHSCRQTVAGAWQRECRRSRRCLARAFPARVRIIMPSDIIGSFMTVTCICWANLAPNADLVAIR